MSFREKSAWICLITTLAIFIPYFVYVFRLIAQPDLAAPDIVTALIAGVLPLMIWGGAHSILFFSQLLLLSFVAAETARYVAQVIRYRAGA